MAKKIVLAGILIVLAAGVAFYVWKRSNEVRCLQSQVAFWENFTLDLPGLLQKNGEALPISGGVLCAPAPGQRLPEQQGQVLVCIREATQPLWSAEWFQPLPADRREITLPRERYLKLLERKMMALRFLCDYLEADLFDQNSELMQKHLQQLVTLATRNLGVQGDPLIETNAAMLVFGAVGRLLNNTTPQIREQLLPQLPEILAPYRQYLTQIAASGQGEADGKIFRSIDRLLATGLAVLRYHDEQQRWVERLSELPTAYLAEEERIDPWSGGELILKKERIAPDRVPEGWTCEVIRIYTIGSNLRDDQGNLFTGTRPDNDDNTLLLRTFEDEATAAEVGAAD